MGRVLRRGLCPNVYNRHHPVCDKVDGPRRPRRRELDAFYRPDAQIARLQSDREYVALGCTAGGRGDKQAPCSAPCPIRVRVSDSRRCRCCRGGGGNLKREEYAFPVRRLVVIPRRPRWRRDRLKRRVVNGRSPVPNPVENENEERRPSCCSTARQYGGGDRHNKCELTRRWVFPPQEIRAPCRA